MGDGALAPRLAVAGFGLAEEEMKNGKDQRRKKEVKKSNKRDYK